MGKTANIIVDEESSMGGDHLHPRIYLNRSRGEDNPDANTGTTMSKQISEASFQPPSKAVRDEELIEDSEVSNDTSSSTTVATITNLHVLEQDSERKTRYFDVSDPSHDSSSTSTEYEHQEAERCPREDQHNGDECYNKIKRACDIVDFVLAGDIIPSYFSPNKKLRTK